VPNFVSVVASIVELAHGEKSCTQSLSLFEPKLALENYHVALVGGKRHIYIILIPFNN